MEHYKSRNNDYFHFTNPHDDLSDFDDDNDDDPNNESQYDDVDDDDDDRSCDFNFHTYHPVVFHRSPPPNSQASGVMKGRNGTVEFGAFDDEALIFQLDNRMKNMFDKLQHTVEGIGTKISNLEDGTCKLDNYVEDVKSSEERYHGTTQRKLRRMQTVLQEVHDGVLFLRDKHEIAGTRLQLAILRGSKRDEVNIFPQSSCSTPFFDQRSNELTLSQAVSYHPRVSQAHEVAAQQYIIPQNQQSHTPPFPHFVQPKLSHPRNYMSEFHAKYIPEFTSVSNPHLHGELSSSYKMSNVKPLDSFLHPQEESSRCNYIHASVAQTLPHALPTAVDVIEESRSEEIGNTIRVDDVVDQVTGMGFRRDLVRACVRKLTVNGSRVDLNSVLDKMMNSK